MEIINVTILENGNRLENCFVRTNGGMIVRTGSMKDYKKEDSRVIDGNAGNLCPGFIDIHNHGAKGLDAMDMTSEALLGISGFHLRNGVTSFLATTMTGPLSSVVKICEILEKGLDAEADILGLHMEGPFLSQKNKGAQPEEYLLEPDEENMRIIERLAPHVKLITVSPDVKNIVELIDFCRAHQIVVSGGHDGAIDDEVYEAIAHGMKSVTHLYCCSSSVSRRDSAKKHIGLTEIALLKDELYTEVIADGHHISNDLFRLIYKCKGYRRICLVSDAIRAAGMGEGSVFLGDKEHGVEVLVQDGIAILEKEKVYAGSVTTISRMVERLVQELEIPIEEVCYMASSAQAELLGLTDRGHIKEGCLAHMNLLGADGTIQITIKGEKIYEKI